MSSPTVLTYVTYTKGAEDYLRKHPVLDFLFTHQEAFDFGSMKDEPYTVFHTDDYTFTAPDGVVAAPGEASWKAWLEEYAPFNKTYHEARYVNVYERDGGWEMIGAARIFANLHAPGEQTKTDLKGGKWDIEVPGAFIFNCVKDPAGPRGFKVKSLTLFGNKLPVVQEMMKRGMIKPEDLSK